MSIVAVPLPEAQIEECENLKERIKNNDVIIVDVRLPDEIKQNGKIESERWMNIPDYLGVGTEFSLSNEEFKNKYGIDKPEKPGNELVFHCLGGKKGSNSVAAMTKIGYNSCRNLNGGFMSWSAMKKEQ